jgi:hypothetical protein
MASNNILDPYFVNIFPHISPQQQREGVDLLKAKCTEVEGAGSTDAQLTMMGHLDAIALPENERKAIVAAGLDQCYWQLSKFLRVSNHALLLRPKHSLFLSCSIQPFTNRRSGTLSKERCCSLYG